MPCVFERGEYVYTRHDKICAWQVTQIKRGIWLVFPETFSFEKCAQTDAVWGACLLSKEVGFERR